MDRTTTKTAEERAQERVKNFTDAMWHLATFIIINGFLWTLDIIGGGGVNWAFWVTLSWGIGLAFHLAAYFLDERGFQARRYQRILEEEREKEDATF